jgi:hypothetical protein
MPTLTLSTCSYRNEPTLGSIPQKNKIQIHVEDSLCAFILAVVLVTVKFILAVVLVAVEFILAVVLVAAHVKIGLAAGTATITSRGGMRKTMTTLVTYLGVQLCTTMAAEAQEMKASMKNGCTTVCGLCARGGGMDVALSYENIRGLRTS